MKLSASIVLYNTKTEDLKRVINSYFSYKGEKQLFLIDNSPTDRLKEIVKVYPNNNIYYIFNNENMGYGKAHNIAIKKSIEQNLPYHIILNPDIIIEKDVLEKLANYMELHPEVGNIMPKIIYPDGELQYLCKLLPSPIDLIFRRFIPIKKWKDAINRKYELHSFGYDKIMNIPNLSGCFMFLRTEALKKVGLFDENIFMYLEDIDLNRRIFSKYKTIYYPDATVIHEHQKESYKNKKLLKVHIQSAIYYFNKYGWFFDKERTNINRNVLRELEKLK
ncbi:glycosyltransferase family 2 protein [uncultured Capnocytophaga sp.]|jgi:glycosyltransferase, family 2|uniref:glycosyltransferase family 2 protein n=1 Tax=uncultured Capnocytophaga sp. TaxID=159273 RepID=UPI00262AD94D|nr:glycosyltransferase family 2 protein [uncultured Capnocytophaga sp.]